METNINPKLRRIAILEVDQASSTVNNCGIGVVKKSIADTQFPESDTIEHFYGSQEFINHTLVVCLYHTGDGKEVRRRMLVTPSVKFDDIKKDMETAANSVGVHISYHDLEVTTKQIESEDRDKKVKEREMFLYSLVEYYSGELGKDVEGNLEEIREKLLRVAARDGNHTLSSIGSFLDRYLESKDNLYKLAGLFGKHLGEADLKLDTKYIPEENGSILVEFPFGFNFGDFYIKSAFISSVRLKDGITKALNIVCPKYIDSTWDGTLFSTTLAIHESSDVEDSLNKTLAGNKDFEGDNEDTFKDLSRLCLKCLIYINSEEASLKREKGAITKQKNIAKIRKFYKRNCPFDITTLGYSFHVINGGEEYMVRGHFRWQPFGVKLSKIKLIWIDSFPKNKNTGG